MDHSNHIRLGVNEFTPQTLVDATVYGPGNETVGTVTHVNGAGESAQAIVDVGGFLGIGAKSVAINARDIDFMRDVNGTVHGVTAWTKDQLKDMPEQPY